MRTDSQIKRRTALVGAGAGAITTGLVPLLPAAHAAKRNDREIQRRRDRILLGRDSSNGWPMEKGTDFGGSIWTRPLVGAGGVALRIGDVEAVLLRVARRFHYEVLALEPGDVVGYRRPRHLGRGPESNHASGTAIDILPRGLPSGVRNLAAGQIDIVRDIVSATDGVVAWGGDEIVPAECHFHIAVGPQDGRLAELAARIRIEDELPAAGVGTTL